MIEINETFTVSLSNPSNATLADDFGLGTITDDDPEPSLSVTDVTVTEGNTGTVNATFTRHAFRRQRPRGVGQLRDCQRHGGGPGRLRRDGRHANFAAGETTQTVTVHVNGDLLDEPNETFFVNLSDALERDARRRARASGRSRTTTRAPTVSIGDATVTEGDAGTTDAVFTASLSSPSGLPVTVDFASADGTATSPADYAAASGAPQLRAGRDVEDDHGRGRRRPRSTRIGRDVHDRSLEPVECDASATTSASGRSPTTTRCRLSPIDDVTVTEGNAGTVNAVFTVTLSPLCGHARSRSTTQRRTTRQRAGPDYVSTSGTLNFAAGETTETVAVTVNGDLLDEIDETFFVDLSGPDERDDLRCSVASGRSPMTTRSRSLSVDDVTVTRRRHGTATFTVTLSAASGQDVTVDYATADGTAWADPPSTEEQDYVAASGSLTFLPGQTSKTVVITIFDPGWYDELDETFFLNLTNAAGASIADAQGVAHDARQRPAAEPLDRGRRVAGRSVLRADSRHLERGAEPARRHGRLRGRTGLGDIAGRLHGQQRDDERQRDRRLDRVSRADLGDALDEDDETFSVVLSNPVNFTIVDDTGVGTITDDDPPPALSVNDVTVTEGDSGTASATFTATLSAASGLPVSVNYATANDSAVAPGDFTTAGGTLDFAAGVTSQTVTVNVNGDLLDEANETFFLDLSGASNATISDSRGVGTITDDDASPTLSVNDVTVTEGNAGTVDATFTVTLSAASGRDVSVDYATEDDTARSSASGSPPPEVDYASASGTLAFLAAQTSRTVTVTVNGGDVDELDETFFLNLSNPVAASIADGQGVGTILDDDPPSTVEIDDVVSMDEDGENLGFTVSRSGHSELPFTATYTTSDGTATAGDDYTAVTGTVYIAGGDGTGHFDVPVLDDLFDEDAETLTVTLSNPINGTIVDGEGLGTITDDDPTPTLSVDDVTVTEGNSGTTSATFTAALSAASGQAVSVNYATANDSAVAPGDFTAVGGTLNFAAGVTTQTVTVAVNGDLLDEANETFFLNLSGASNATIADGQGVGTITDDDPEPSLSVDNVTVAEGNSGTVAATFNVSLSPVSGRTVTVDYATADDSASAGLDYEAAAGTLSFAPGDTNKTVTVLVNGDALDEIDENFFINLSNALNASIVDAQGLGTITDDDSLPSVAIGDVTVTEGDTGTVTASFNVTLAPASGRQVSVSYATADGTATAPADYSATSGGLTFAAGETTKQVTVPVHNDVLDEIDESFTVGLSSAVDATISDDLGLGTITDNDPLPALSINDVTVTEGDGANVNANFTVNLGAPSGRQVTVDFSTANGTATAPADYQTGNGTVSFPAGQTAQQVSIQVNGDLARRDRRELPRQPHQPLERRHHRPAGPRDDHRQRSAPGDLHRRRGGDRGRRRHGHRELHCQPERAERAPGLRRLRDCERRPRPRRPTTRRPPEPSASPRDKPRGRSTVQVNADLLDEDDETFTVNLSGAVDASIADRKASARSPTTTRCRRCRSTT